MQTESLRSDPLFSEFTDEELSHFQKILVERNLQSGQTLVREGDSALSLFILESGSVDILKRSSEGDRPRLSTIVPGTIFGELALIDQTTRTADVVVRDTGKAYELSYSALEQLILQYPLIGVKVYKIIIKGLIEKTKKTTDDLMAIVVSSRIAALGEMASSIAHEINSPLTIIRLHAETIDEMTKRNPVNLETISKSGSKILVNVDRITKLIRSVRSLSRNAENDPMTESSVTEILDQVQELSVARFKNGEVNLSIRVPSVDIKMICRSVQISQVLLNLLNNAFDAVKTQPGAWVTLDVEDQAESVLFSITDSGLGIPPEIREKIFQSFFTTKASGQGTGLGLSISLKIVEDHRGEITLDQECKNTRFLIRFPKG